MHRAPGFALRTLENRKSRIVVTSSQIQKLVAVRAGLQRQFPNYAFSIDEIGIQRHLPRRRPVRQRISTSQGSIFTYRYSSLRTEPRTPSPPPLPRNCSDEELTEFLHFLHSGEPDAEPQSTLESPQFRPSHSTILPGHDLPRIASQPTASRAPSED